MITKLTIAKIFEASRVEEVVGDFVSLKKRGANMVGLCPFHNEKTPSFYVSPSKGIYKCFGCGKAGNSVNFMMDHDSLSYPEALRYLASKYNIEIEEDHRETPEEQKLRKAEEEERESLMVVSSFAQKHFTKNLNETDEGKSVGLGYFIERGFRKDILDKFQLGYSFDQWREFSDAAIAAGFKLENIEKAGLTIIKSRQSAVGSEESQKLIDEPDSSLTTHDSRLTTYFDRFSARVMFPVHNLTGRVIAFGGRTLKSDKKIAKYINSPETPIYHKSNVLYGLFFGKKMIVQEDNCFLVEGYTDVISMHQSGIENVVASSGTSLTVEQIRAIRRYTPNITILFDGDPAGIKASFRGIDLILEEGMNVRVLLFPDGDDPDSYSKKVAPEEFREFIKKNTRDFISFKTELLYSDIQGDPIKKAELIKDIVGSIALIPDQIKRSVFIQKCSKLMDLAEQSLLNELNRVRSKKFDERRKKEEADSLPEHVQIPVLPGDDKPLFLHSQEHQERDLIRILLNYGRELVPYETIDVNNQKVTLMVTVAEYIITGIQQDQMEFEVQTFQKIFNEYDRCYREETIPETSHFTQNPDIEISLPAIDLLTSEYELSDWEKHGILVKTEVQVLRESVEGAIMTLRLKKLEKMKQVLQDELKAQSDPGEIDIIMHKLRKLEEVKGHLAGVLGRVVLK